LVRIAGSRSCRITILRDRVAELRPLFVLADPCRRARHEPGKVAQWDLSRADALILTAGSRGFECIAHGAGRADEREDHLPRNATRHSSGASSDQHRNSIPSTPDVRRSSDNRLNLTDPTPTRRIPDTHLHSFEWPSR
jgi:hypothetical protein